MTNTRLATLLSCAFLTLPAAAQTATYEVQFDAAWSSTTHPGAYPAGAHFSPLVGGTHDGGVSFWAPGATATMGIEVMAETGGTGFLQAEVNSAITAGTAGELILGSGIGSPGSTTTTFDVSTTHSLVTLVTMVAPSPDWFVGVHGLELFESGAFVKSKTVDLYAYDAGTDSGSDFTSPNQDTNPQSPIALITGGPFFGVTPLGTFTFTLQGAITTYCTPKVNSQGCVSNLFTSGTPSLTDPNPFDLFTALVVGEKNGLLFYGYGSAAIPFFGGTLCVQPPLRRTGIQNSLGIVSIPCDGIFSFDMNAWIQSGVDPLMTVGTDVFAQFWYRDPADAAGVGLTDAVQFPVCP